METQDRQDNQEGRLLRQGLTSEVIAWEFAYVHDGVAAKQIHGYSCLFVFVRGSSLWRTECFTRE